MSTSIKRCPNFECNQAFQVNRFPGHIGAFATHGEITCPHCGYSVSGDARSIFITHAISAEEEQWFAAQEQMEDARRS